MTFRLIMTMFVVLIITPPLSPATPLPSMAKTNCVDRCGDVIIPFPFGTTENCYLSREFFVSCNQTVSPPTLFMQNSSIEIISISLEGQLRVMQYIAKECYDRNGRKTLSNRPFIRIFPFTVSETANKFTIVGCDAYGYISGSRLNRNYTTGCTAMCDSIEDLSDGSCGGLGCCQTAIPKHVWRVDLQLGSYSNHSDVWDFNNCSYAFLVDESTYTFSRNDLNNLRNVEKLPMVVDWAVGNERCEKAQMNLTSYACKSSLSSVYCSDSSSGPGYRCRCQEGYQGNPYLVDGCQDIDECHDSRLNDCEKICVNTQGSFRCLCPKGYHGGGIKGRKGCIRGESLVYKLVAGIAVGIVVVLFVISWLYIELKRRKFTKIKQKYFVQNGGVLLLEKLARRERSPITVSIFSSTDLQKATNNFHTNRIIGQGGYGIVYKGLLTDGRIVAVKKSKEVDPNQIEQFINEVIVLSQINHRNVVKLLGCCLETQAPILVYEFISNGTLFEHIHKKPNTNNFLDWDSRLKIASETAGVLSYLHSDASTPIVHRDVKTANILLDDTFSAKVSDFGASRLVPLDQTQLSTLVQGTFGYLDPEYLQTNQLTEKSDVYSFGVVLVELLTSMKALSYDRSEKDMNLSNYFLSMLKQEQLFNILDAYIVREGNREQIIEVAGIAKGCLNVRGEDRPSMKEVAMELEGLRLFGKQMWDQTEQNAEEIESLLGERSEGFDSSHDNSASFVYDSLKDHVIFPIRGGR